MPDNQEQSRLKPFQGLAVFAIVILVLPLVAAPMQRRWGMLGLALSEALILLLAIVPAILFKADLRSVFPIRKPLRRQALGVFIMWIGSYLAVMLITLLIAYFFPEGLLRVSGEIQQIFTSVPFPIALFVIAVMPAICEEALHRGLILSSLRPINRKWVLVLVMGAIFGIFHLDPYRFLPTAVMGMAISYIMIETGNLVLPMLFHFINNGLTTLAAFANRSAVSMGSPALPPDFDPEMLLMAFAVYLIIGSAFPFLLLWGSRLLHEKGAPGETDMAAALKRRRMDRIAFLCTAVMVVAGVVILTFIVSRAMYSADPFWEQWQPGA